jgi:hypothetical protein
MRGRVGDDAKMCFHEISFARPSPLFWWTGGRRTRRWALSAVVLSDRVAGVLEVGDAKAESATKANGRDLPAAHSPVKSWDTDGEMPCRRISGDVGFMGTHEKSSPQA